MNVQNTELVSDRIIPYHYYRAQITNSIIHIGVGNFHRAHQQFYTNFLLEDPDQQQWGICGVALLPGDKALVRSLQRQAGEYTLTVCGRDGIDQAYRIGSLTRLIWGVEKPAAVIDAIAEPGIRIITLTITEGGYFIDAASKTFSDDDPAIVHDISHPSAPRTVFGFVAEGLRRRMKAGLPGLTILSCDNLQHNGRTARLAFLSFFGSQDKELAEWAAENVSFPNSMVDRITPATKPEDIDRLNIKNDTLDEAPVYCEDFTQWVIEDNFISGRPAWERVGVEFTDDVAQYENMKLSLLNASHLLLAFPAFLAGYRKVDEAMKDRYLSSLLKQFMDIDITPYVPAPRNTDLEVYKATLLARFANPSVGDQVSRLCSDGLSKFPVYIMPKLAKMVKDGKDLKRLAYLFACYRHYLRYKVDDSGELFSVTEPWMTEQELAHLISDDPVDFLDIRSFSSVPLARSDEFVASYLTFCESIKADGVLSVLVTIV